MTRSVRDIIPIRTLPKVMQAVYYNRVRLALLRLGNPLRLEMPGLRGIDVILDDSAWMAVDRNQVDMPLLAWTDFDSRRREALHQAVPCRMHLYHFHAGLLMGDLLDNLEFAVDERLSQWGSLSSCRVSTLADRLRV
ncbi:MAG TPA: hypothetical protein VKA13_00970 [Gammaproteobacteria bacterium]|nr:hypothetical protein [Gammaproteobacteria bacterium]